MPQSSKPIELEPSLEVNKVLFLAYRAYCKITNSSSEINTITAFYKFLGIKPKCGSYPVVFFKGNLPDEAMKKIKWLNSPDAKLLYKIWKIQNE